MLLLKIVSTEKPALLSNSTSSEYLLNTSLVSTNDNYKLYNSPLLLIATL